MEILSRGIMGLRLRIARPYPCSDCSEERGKPIVYKRIGAINAYYVECSQCLKRSRYYQEIEDAICAWDNDETIRGQNEK